MFKGTENLEVGFDREELANAPERRRTSGPEFQFFSATGLGVKLAKRTREVISCGIWEYCFLSRNRTGFGLLYPLSIAFTFGDTWTFLPRQECAYYIYFVAPKTSQ